LEWRIVRANLPERWSLETFPWSRQPGVNRKQIRSFAELDFVAKHENLVFVGKTGVGKSGLACSLLLKALQNGYRCQFIRAQDLESRVSPEYYRYLRFKIQRFLQTANAR
jgi:DNA replication protein DnaC